jgi:hypothetical protein
MRNFLSTGIAALALAVSAAVAPAAAASVYGTPVAEPNWVDSRTLNAFELETGGATVISTLNLSWNIGYDLGLWNYSYTMSWTPEGATAISHFILDLSDDCTSAASGCVINPKVGGVDPKEIEYGEFKKGVSNPEMGGPIQGVKFDMPTGVGSSPFTLTFESERAPVWGDFYTKAGTVTGVGWYSQNVGIDNHGSDNILNFIARPNGEGAPVCANGAPNWPVCSFQEVETPEPMSLALLGMGLLGLAGIRARRRRAVQA